MGGVHAAGKEVAADKVEQVQAGNQVVVKQELEGQDDVVDEQVTEKEQNAVSDPGLKETNEPNENETNKTNENVDTFNHADVSAYNDEKVEEESEHTEVKYNEENAVSKNKGSFDENIVGNIEVKEREEVKQELLEGQVDEVDEQLTEKDQNAVGDPGQIETNKPTENETKTKNEDVDTFNHAEVSVYNDDDEVQEESEHTEVTYKKENEKSKFKESLEENIVGSIEDKEKEEVNVFEAEKQNGYKTLDSFQNKTKKRNVKEETVANNALNPENIYMAETYKQSKSAGNAMTTIIHDTPKEGDKKHADDTETEMEHINEACTQANVDEKEAMKRKQFCSEVKEEQPPNKKKWKVDPKCSFPECDYATEVTRNMRNHLLTHSGEKPYKCNQCDFAFITPANLRNHVNSKHTKEKPHACKHCDEKFSSSSARRQHVRTKHEQVVKIHKCDTCGCSSNQVQALKIHKRIHTGDKPFECTMCEECFRQKAHLNRHTAKEHTVKEDEKDHGKLN